MRAQSLIMGWVLLAAGAPSAWAYGHGLTLDSDRWAWPHWQARLQVNTDATVDSIEPSLQSGAYRPRSAALLGDYYVSRALFGETGGLRLTSGVFVGSRRALFGPAGPADFSTSFTAKVARNLASVPVGLDTATESTLTWPYLGVGYSGGSLRGGWGFSADLGWAAQNPGALRLGRTFSNQPLDETVRELRLLPVLQLGVSYKF